MGISPLPLFAFDMNGIQEKQEMPDSNGFSLWSKVKKQRTSRRKVRHIWSRRRPRSILMKRRRRRAGVEGSRRPVNPIEKKLKTLKKRIPNNEPMGLDGLFRETADYILALQMRVKVMQIMVKVLTGSDE